MAIYAAQRPSNILGQMGQLTSLAEVGRQRSREAIAQLPSRLANTALMTIENMRARRAAKSAASEARKQQRLTMGIAGGAGAVGGGIAGSILGPALGAATGTAISPTLGALAGGGLGLAGGLSAGAVGGAGTVPSIGQVYGQAQEMQWNAAMGDFWNKMAANIIGLGNGGAGGAVSATPAQPAGAATMRLPEPTAGGLPSSLTQRATGEAGPAAKQSALEKAVGEPSGAALVTPDVMQEAAQRMRAIGQQRIDEGKADEALRLARMMLEWETGRAA